MTDKQPEALRLADLINERPDAPLVVKAAAAELRRLHEENERLTRLAEFQDKRIRIMEDDSRAYGDHIRAMLREQLEGKQ